MVQVVPAITLHKLLELLHCMDIAGKLRSAARPLCVEGV